MSAGAVASLSPREVAPGKVHIAPGLFDEIATLVLEGYSATSHGGLEIGGVLFGRRESGQVYVEAFRPLACEHSHGPRFVLSDNDEHRLRELLEAPAKDIALLGVEAVGWYCSHTRSDLRLLDRELLLHKTYFDGPDDFGLILKPRDMHAVDSAIFFPGNGGEPAGPITRANSESPSEQTQRAIKQPVAPSLPAEDVSPNARGRWIRFAIGAGIGATVCFGAWEFVDQTRSNSVPPSPATNELAVNLRPQAEDLALSWRSNINQPKRARVEIFDGPVRKDLDLTDVFQPSGLVLFPHNTGNVEAVLTVELNGGAVVRRIGFTDGQARVTIPESVAPVMLVSEAPNRRLRHKRHKRSQ